VHPVAKDGSRIFKDATEIDEIVERDGQRFGKFIDPETGDYRFWPIEQFESALIPSARVWPAEGSWLPPRFLLPTGGV